MPRDEIRLNARSYTVARGKAGQRLWGLSARASQPGDPGQQRVAEWRVDGPDLFSFETEDGYLGRDYGSNTDGRWEGLDTLGPLINAITLSTHDSAHDASIPGTPAFVPGTTLIPGSALAAADADGQDSFGPYAYIMRGQQPAKVLLSDMTLKRTGRTFPEPARTVLRTRSRAEIAPDELSAGLGEAAPYEVLTIAAPGVNSDTWQANDDGATATVLATAPDRIVALTGETVTGNILTGAVTMRSPNWNTVATLTGEPVEMTGFGLDGSLWVIGTSNGPYMLDSDTAEFFPLIDEIDPDPENSRGMTSWFPIGVIIPLRDGVRYQAGGSGESWGVEQFGRNTSPVQGYPTGHAGSTKWLYQALYNEEAGDTYLIAWRPRESGDRHPHPLTPFVIARFTDTPSRYLSYIGRANGLRTNPTLMGGYGSNAFWMTVGRTSREIDDANYRYAASGSTHLTELRRSPSTLKDVELVEFEADHCSLTQTITVSLAMDGVTAVALDGNRTYGDGRTMNGTVISDGFQRILATDDSGKPLATLSGRRIKPLIAYATASSSAAPQLLGNFRVYYRERPLMVRVFQFTLGLAGRNEATAKEQVKRILDEYGSGPVSLETPDGERLYVRVEAARTEEIVGEGGGQDSAQGTKWGATITATEWQTADA